MSDNPLVTHTMVMLDIRPDGSIEWMCPVCFYHFIEHPRGTHPRREVQQAGDEQARHVGAAGLPGAVLNLNADVEQDHYLDVFDTFLKEKGL